jgi:hypothetical protein
MALQVVGDACVRTKFLCKVDESGTVEPAFLGAAKVAKIASTESLVDLKRASDILGLSIWTVRDLIWSKEIPAHHIGPETLHKDL